MIEEYEDIIGFPHYRSGKHLPMAEYARAAQFAPFAALTGYAEAIRETARQTEKRPDLDEDRLTELDAKLSALRELLYLQPKVTITWFAEDGRKSGGSYRITEGTVKQIDAYGQRVVMTDGSVIAVGDIVGLDWNGDSGVVSE